MQVHSIVANIQLIIIVIMRVNFWLQSISNTILLTGILNHTQSSPLFAKMLTTIFCIAPVAFMMGFPFPFYLKSVAAKYEQYIALAWAANGCASVIATSASAILAMSIGFNQVLIAAMVLYAVSLVLFFYFKQTVRK